VIAKALRESVQYMLHPHFKSHIWKTRHDLRKYYVRDLIRDPEIPGKTRMEIENMLGPDESRTQLPERWSYRIGMINKRKYYLVFEFRDHRVSCVRYIYKNVYKMGYSK